MKKTAVSAFLSLLLIGGNPTVTGWRKEGGKMKKARRSISWSTIIATTALLVACPSSLLLTDIEQKVNQAQTAGMQTVATPAFNPESGSYPANQWIEIRDGTPGASIYYTTATGGSTPPDPTTGSQIYGMAIFLSGTDGTVITIKALAVAPGMKNSIVASAIYTINNKIVATPRITPVPGRYDSSQLVTITDDTPGASIYYTLNGSTPTSATGLPYGGSMNVSTTLIVKAIACGTGLTDSSVLTATYTLPDSTPVFSPSDGTYLSQQSVTITTTMPGATIRYLTDGTTPTDTTGTLYSGPVVVASNKILKAIACEAGWASSFVGTASYNFVPPATPIGLVVASPTATSLSVSWNSSTAATSYQVYRDTTLVYSGTDTNFTDSSLASGTTYYYKVAATGVGGQSAFSTTVSGLTVPARPAGLTVRTGPIVSWNESTGTTAYSLGWYYQKDAMGLPKNESIIFIGSSLSYDHTIKVQTMLASGTLSHGQTIWYYVYASNASGSSPPTSKNDILKYSVAYTLP